MQWTVAKMFMVYYFNDNLCLFEDTFYFEDCICLYLFYRFIYNANMSKYLNLHTIFFKENFITDFQRVKILIKVELL